VDKHNQYLKQAKSWKKKAQQKASFSPQSWRAHKTEIRVKYQKKGESCIQRRVEKG